MEDFIKFSLETEDLEHLIRRLKLVEQVNRRKKHKIYCEVTVKEGCVEFNSPGYFQVITAQTTGICRFSTSISFFIKLLKSYKKSVLHFEVSYQWLWIEDFSVKVKTTFFQDDKILRSLQLPINYNYVELLKVSPASFTKDEIELINVDMQLKKAKEMFLLDLVAAHKLLEIYKIDFNSFRNWACIELGLNPLDFVPNEIELQTTNNDK